MNLKHVMIVVVYRLYTVLSGSVVVFQVAASALLCVAEVVSGLKAHAIPILPQLMPSILKLIKRNEKDW